ncbi:MAG: restriction endonuclease, partial [Terriglobia bacterium]
ALPLRDDFSIYLDGTKLEASKAGKGRIGRWVLGKDIDRLPKPAPDEIEAVEDRDQPIDSEARFALQHKAVGRITGYVEIYRELLTGSSIKSDDLGRSHGFFVYVRGRLINVEDGHFGISPDELRHGTFGRIRVVVHMDALDDYLQSDRERIRQGPVLNDAQNILRAIFNRIRPELERADEAEEPGARLARKLAGSPASLARRPIIEMARAALHGRIRARYISIPPADTQAERDKLIAVLEARAETPGQFVGGIEFVYDGTSGDGIAVYDAVTGRLKVNGLHPFVGAFFDEFTSKTSGLPLEVFAMAEVLLESHLYQSNLNQTQIDGVMTMRDQLLRYVATESGRMTPLMIANALRNARNDQHELEIWVVEAFRSLGFEATRIGGKGKPDGIAEAPLGPDAKKQQQRYKVSLEAKSKQKAGAKVSAKAVGISAIARQRKDFDAHHAVVVGQLFPTSQSEASALAKEIKEDRKLTNAAKDPRTITLIHIEDLANLVQHRPVKALTLQRIREMLQTQSLPEECKKWVDAVLAERPVRHDYATIVTTIAR